MSNIETIGGKIYTVEQLNFYTKRLIEEGKGHLPIYIDSYDTFDIEEVEDIGSKYVNKYIRLDGYYTNYN
jgi:hypothetical protein